MADLNGASIPHCSRPVNPQLRHGDPQATDARAFSALGQWHDKRKVRLTRSVAPPGYWLRSVRLGFVGGRRPVVRAAAQRLGMTNESGGPHEIWSHTLRTTVSILFAFRLVWLYNGAMDGQTIGLFETEKNHRAGMAELRQ